MINQATDLQDAKDLTGWADVDSKPFLAFEHEAETDGDHQRDQDGGEEV